MSFARWLGGIKGGRLWNRARLQWAPTLTAHDPNPPINLEDPAGGGGGSSGSLTQTLGALVLAATAVVPIHGATAATLGSLSAAGTAKVAVKGSTSATLAPATLVGTGKVKVQGASAPTLGPVTLAAAGSVKVRGSTSSTLDALTLAGASQAKIQGSASQTLDALTLVGTGQAGPPPEPPPPPVFGPHEYPVYPRVVHEQGYVETEVRPAVKVYKTGARIRARLSLRVGKAVVIRPAPARRSKRAHPVPAAPVVVARPAPPVVVVMSTGASLVAKAEVRAAGLAIVPFGAVLHDAVRLRATAEIVPDPDLSVLEDDDDLDLLHDL